jgi:hypothetical protein
MDCKEEVPMGKLLIVMLLLLICATLEVPEDYQWSLVGKTIKQLPHNERRSAEVVKHSLRQKQPTQQRAQAALALRPSQSRGFHDDKAVFNVFFEMRLLVCPAPRDF